jgi:hypothetical protein
MHRFTRSARITGIAAGVGGVLVAVQLCGAAAASAATTTVTLPAVLSAIKQCESGGNYTAVNPTSGASGAYQFLTSTWQSLSASAGYATAAAAPAAVQDAAALELYNAEGTTPWVSSESCWGSAAGSSATSSATSTTLSPASAATASTGSTGSVASTGSAPAIVPGFAASYRQHPGGWDPTFAASAGSGVTACHGAGPGLR